MGGIEDLIDSRITAGDNRKTLNRVSGAKLASEKATEAKERAEESIEEAAGKLGYINFDELWADGKLSGTLDGELPGVFIRNIAAEEILAGDIDAEYLNVRGHINIGPVRLDPDGITLPATNELEDTMTNLARKIKPSGGWGSLEFGGGSTGRGPSLTSVGEVSSNVEGVVRIIAKTWSGASVTGNSTAYAQAQSTRNGRGLFRLLNGTDLQVNGFATFTGGINLEGWSTLSPLNGWVNASGQPIQQRLTADKGHVELRGALVNGPSGGALFFLPVGRRPPTDRQYVVGAGGGWALINVQANGGVQIANSAASSPGWIHLAGVTFEI